MNDRLDLIPAALYARVSSDRQDVDLSVAAQLRALRDYAQKNGYLVAREYVDEAENGRIADRPQFQRMLDEASKPEAPFKEIMNGRNSPSAVVLRKLHGVLFKPTRAERVMPAEVKVLGWRKGERSGMVVRGAGGPGRGNKDGGGTVRVGGHVPWGAKAEFAYRAGYDGMGRLSVTHVVERGYSAMLKQPEMAAA